MKYPMALVHIAADVDPLMARDAAERFEQLIAGELLGGDRVDVALEPPIKSAAGREQGPLIARNGSEQCRAIWLAAKGCTKLTGDIRVGPQFVQRFLHTRPHSVRFVQGLLDLAFKRAKDRKSTRL